MKLTQKQAIISYLRWVNDWIPSYKLRSLETPFGWIGIQGDRRARELAQEGKIDHKIEGKYSYYKAKEPQYKTITTIHPVSGEREQKKLRIN
jgi:hypothetical protein